IFNYTLVFCFIVLLFMFTDAEKRITLSLHDALPICGARRTRPARGSRPGPPPAARPARRRQGPRAAGRRRAHRDADRRRTRSRRSEEHTSELQSRENLVCRLLLEKKKLIIYIITILI